MGSEAVWRVIDVLEWTRSFFATRGIESARLDAEVLLAHVLGVPRIMLYARFDQPLTDAERVALRELVKRRASREPVAYLVGKKEFWSMTLETPPGVLIPRSDTETLVSAALDHAPKDTAALRIVDAGTGSGAVALALAKELPNAQIVAYDVSQFALQVARTNAQALGLSDRISFVCASALSALEEAPFGLIVANLPYIPSAAIGSLMPDVRHHEPHLASTAGPMASSWSLR
ncbi:MAG: peptide chain release factor N(5)-glutamine methyltransferase [Myxococcales bacterium]|nr:peptide chain release factor N(5)-glutamine methyltransferase [Myxococcales bacterium]